MEMGKKATHHTCMVLTITFLRTITRTAASTNDYPPPTLNRSDHGSAAPAPRHAQPHYSQPQYAHNF